MARVSHKKIHQMINQKRKTITDRQLFSSRLFAGHFEDMAAAQTKRYGYNRGVRVKTVWEPKNQDTARTNNALIWINAGHSMVTAKKTRVERYDIVCGLFAHELGHVLYTDFLTAQSYTQFLRVGKWFPVQPILRNSADVANEADIWAYTKSTPKQMDRLVKLAAYLGNIIEDGFIESKMLDRYPGVLGYSLEAMREHDFETQPTLTQVIETETTEGHMWLSIMQLMLSYVKFGELKYGEEPLSDERVQVIFSLLPELDRALTAESAKERWDVVNTILVRCWPYIKSFLEYCAERPENPASADSDNDALIDELLSALAGGSSEGTGDTPPVTEQANGQPSTPPSSSAPAKRAITAKDAETAKSLKDPGNDEKEGAAAEESNVSEEPSHAADSTEPVKQNGMSGNSDKTEVPGDSPEPGTSTNQAFQDVSADEGGRIPLTQTDDIFVPTGGEMSSDNGYTGSGYPKAAEDIDRLLERMAEKAVTSELENQRLSELNDLANSISYGDVHEGIHKVVHRMDEVKDELKEQYQEVAGPLLHISKLLRRSVSQQLKDKRRGGKQTGLLIGRRLNAHDLPRNDGRVFYKNSLPTEAPEMALALLLDESGSMCSGDRVTYARATAIILYDFCRSLDIPIMVYGHSTNYTKNGRCVDLYSYAEFDDIDGGDRYRMMDISSRNSNRDGAAIRFVAERLSKRREDIKILILVSDGQPADAGYGGTTAEEDLRGVKHEYVKKGILFVAAAIGDDKEDIERIYGDSYLDITDLNKLPIALTNVVKRFIKI